MCVVKYPGTNVLNILYYTRLVHIRNLSQAPSVTVSFQSHRHPSLTFLYFIDLPDFWLQHTSDKHKCVGKKEKQEQRRHRLLKT